MSSHLTRFWNLQKLRPNKNKFTLYFKAPHFFKENMVLYFCTLSQAKKTYTNLIIGLLKKFQQSSVFIFKQKEA
jgi:hypothetical protein